MRADCPVELLMIRALILALLCSVSLGCKTVAFSQPLGSESFQEKDLEAYGRWYLFEDGELLEEGVLHFGFDKGLKQSRMIVVGTDLENGELEVVYRNGYINKIGDKNFFSFRNPDETDESNFQIINYEIDGDEFIWRCIDRDEIEKAVHDGVLKGYVSVTRSSRFTSTHIQVTDTAENVRRYLVENGNEIFSRCWILSEFALRRVQIVEIK